MGPDLSSPYLARPGRREEQGGLPALGRVGRSRACAGKLPALRALGPGPQPSGQSLAWGWGAVLSLHFPANLGKLGWESLLPSGAVPCIFLTPSSWHPGPGAPPHLLCLWAGGDPSHPFACPESSLGPEEEVGHLFPFPASFLLCQGSRRAGQGFHPSFRLSWCHPGPPETHS